MPSEGTAEMKRRRASLRRASLCASLSRRWSRRRRRAGGTTSIPLVGNYSYKEKKKGRQNQRSTKNWNNERSFLFFPIIKRSLSLVYQALRKHHRDIESLLWNQQKSIIQVIRIINRLKQPTAPNLRAALFPRSFLSPPPPLFFPFPSPWGLCANRPY